MGLYGVFGIFVSQVAGIPLHYAMKRCRKGPADDDFDALAMGVYSYNGQLVALALAYFDNSDGAVGWQLVEILVLAAFSTVLVPCVTYFLGYLFWAPAKKGTLRQLPLCAATYPFNIAVFVGWLGIFIAKLPSNTAAGGR